MISTLEPSPVRPVAPRTESVFVDAAAREAAETAAFAGQGDPAAAALLARTRQSIYHWPAGFRGFTARISVHDASATWEGQLTVRSSRDFQLELPGLPTEAPVRGWLKYQLEEMLSHREAPSVSSIASKAGVTFGAEDPIYGQRIDFVGDKMGSWYRLKDDRITQIARGYGRTRFVIHIDSHAELEGRFAAAQYTVFYRSADTGALTKVETYFDTYEPVGPVHLPRLRRVTEAGDAGEVTRQISLREFELLS